MSFFSVPTIFGTTLFSVVIILVSTTILGRAWAAFFPLRLQSLARFYLAPVMGLATLIIMASWMGRFIALGDSVLVPALVMGLVGFALSREPNLWQAIRHGLCNSIFAIACSVSILSPLLIYGGFNAHNDAFTYLAHSNWLQSHAFSEVIAKEQVTPLTTQIALYQNGGFRMGASFLLGLVQSLLNLEWSYEVYPSISISSISACCLAMGFPLAGLLRSIHRNARLMLLALPSFTIGGLIFGANFGFLAQEVGLSMSAGLLFALGPTLRLLSGHGNSARSIGKAAVPVSVLFAATVYAYSELTPLILPTLIISGFFIALRYQSWKKVFFYVGLQLGLASLYLNSEIFRVLAALKVQSAVVVGGAVNWLLPGYFAHVLGCHGGAWDKFQWSLPENIGSASFYLGVVITGVLTIVLLLNSRSTVRVMLNGKLLPAGSFLLIAFAGFIYFRYFVISPFPTGKGQSWNQFKLTEWAHPFAMAFTLLAISGLLKHIGKYIETIITIVFLIGLCVAANFGEKRISPLIQYYGGTRNLYLFYQEFRQTILTTCDNEFPVSIYLALNGQHHKFRQMATYFLPDYNINSDWMDDNVIYGQLSIDRRTKAPTAGDWVVEPADDCFYLRGGTGIGRYRVGKFESSTKVKIKNAIGAFDRESDGVNWWHWVERKVSFQLQQMQDGKTPLKTKLRFEYSTRDFQTLTVNLLTGDGTSRQFSIESNGKGIGTFEKTVSMSPGELAEISIETDGNPSYISEKDSRCAAWMIRNLNVTYIP
jgi:hypothetical protein